MSDAAQPPAADREAILREAAEKVRAEGPAEIRARFNYYAPDGAQPSHSERIAGAVDAVARLIEPELSDGDSPSVPPSIHATDVEGFCPACGHPTLRVGDGGHLVCSLMDCPNPEAADELLRSTAAGQAKERPL
jgi:hypothetical protein